LLQRISVLIRFLNSWGMWKLSSNRHAPTVLVVLIWNICSTGSNPSYYYLASSFKKPPLLGQKARFHPKNKSSFTINKTRNNPHDRKWRRKSPSPTGSSFIPTRASICSRGLSPCSYICLTWGDSENWDTQNREPRFPRTTRQGSKTDRQLRKLSLQNRHQGMGRIDQW